MSAFNSERSVKKFVQKEVEQFMKVNQCSDLDKEGIKLLVAKLHNGIVPNDATVNKFFSNTKTRVDADTIISLLFTEVLIPDIEIAPNNIFPKEQTEIAPFCKPDTSTIEFDDYDFIPFKSGYIKRGTKSLFGFNYQIRFSVLNAESFTIYERDTKDTISMQIQLNDIISMENMPDERHVYPFVIREEGRETILAVDDDVSRVDWIKRISSLIILQMASTGDIIEDRFKNLIQTGANKNACYGRDDTRSVLYYLLKNKQLPLATWLISQGARTSCMLRWQFVVEERVMSPMEVLSIMETNNISISLHSDDGFKYNIMHYMCYFGIIEGVKKLIEYPESQSLLNDTTESNDIAITITLLSPVIDVEKKVYLTYLLYNGSNISICNRASQSPTQIILLMGKISLLFQMLPLATNPRCDTFKNSLLHLAIKAHLPTVARYILRHGYNVLLDQIDCMGDTALTLSIKAGDEELACEILRCGANPDIVCPSWGMEKSEKDLVIHQALKRGMQDLAIAVFSQGNYYLHQDTEGNTPLHISLIRHLDMCSQFLLDSKSVSGYVNAANSTDMDTPLHLTIKLGFYDYARRLLVLGSDVNKVNRFGLTPCHLLVMAAKGDFDAIAHIKLTSDQALQLLQDLLDRRPNTAILSATSSYGGAETCLHTAIRGNERTQTVALMILSYNNNLVDIRDYEMCTPLMRAVEIRNLTLVQALCEANADLNVMTLSRETPLHMAVRNGDVSIVDFLVKHGAYMRMWNTNGLYPIHMALQQGNVDLARILCQRDVDANLPTRKGSSPFVIACLSGSEECIRMLLARNADPYVLNASDQSVLSVIATAVRGAKDAKYARVCQLLLGFIHMFEMEYFGDAKTIANDIATIKTYVDNAISHGEIDSQCPPVEIPLMALEDIIQTSFRLPDIHVDDISNGSIDEEEQAALEEEKKNLRVRKQQITEEIASINRMMGELDSACDGELDSVEDNIVDKSTAWFESDAGKERIAQTVKKLVARNYSVDEANIKAHAIFRQMLVEKGKAKVIEHYDDERIKYQVELHQMESELIEIDKKLM